VWWTAIFRESHAPQMPSVSSNNDDGPAGLINTVTGREELLVKSIQSP
jgi:hypothetical protein